MNDELYNEIKDALPEHLKEKLDRLLDEEGSVAIRKGWECGFMEGESQADNDQWNEAFHKGEQKGYNRGWKDAMNEF